MDLDYLKKLVDIFDDSKAVDLEIEEEGIYLYMSKGNGNQVEGQPAQVMPAVVAPQAPPQVAPAQQQAAPEAPAPKQDEAPADDTEGLHKISSPIVGTFYRAPSPDSEPFVEVGTKVTPGTTLCIVEAMKLMNEIESDIAGTVVKILVKNSEPVEYNQDMFLIKPD